MPKAPDEDLQLMFLNYVDSFTPWHLRVLNFFDNPRDWGQRNKIVFQSYNMGSPSIILEHAFPELKGRRELYDLFVKDLFSSGLMTTDSLHTTMTGEGMFASRTTDIGKQFMRFITSPIDSNE